MIIVDVYVPVLKEKFDFIIDETVDIREITGRITNILCRMQKEETCSGFMLFSCELETVLPEDRSMKELGLKSGSSFLIL